MSDPDRLINELMADDQRVRGARGVAWPVVLYLEGQTDPAILGGLLGVREPTISNDGRFFHRGCLVRGLSAKRGSGATGVRALVNKAQEPGVARGLNARFVGVVDGDGRSLTELHSPFDELNRGPMYDWPAYCIENMLVQAGWPVALGPAPDWAAMMLDHSAYVGLSELWRDIKKILDDLGLRGFPNPNPSGELFTESAVCDVLARGRSRLSGYDVVDQFRAVCADFRTQVDSDISLAHTRLNGKWLVRAAAKRHRLSEEELRATWTRAIALNGGWRPVLEWWVRLTGDQP